MTRSFVHLMTIVLISFSMSILPIDVKSLEINFDNVFKPIEEPGKVTELPSSFSVQTESSVNTLHFNPQFIQLKAEALEKAPDDWNALLKGTLAIVDTATGKELTRYTQDTIMPHMVVKPSDNALSALIELNVPSLNLPNGFYTLSFELTDPALAGSYVYSCHLFKPQPYVKTRGITVENAMKLYFADASRSFLVPVYRPIASTDRMIRSSLNGLLEVPLNMGLYETPLVPRISRADFTGGVTKCNLLSRDLNDTLTTKDVKLMFQSIALTLFEVKSTYVINQVEFIVDGDSSYTYKDVNLGNAYISTDNAQAYLPYTTQQNILLIPFDVETSDTSATVPLLLEALKKPVDLPTGIHPLLPPNLELLSYHIEGRNLVLNFDKAFESLYTDEPQLQDMLIDAIALSFSSLEAIDQVTIQVEGSPFNGWNGATFQNPVLPPTVFNLATS